MPSSITNITNSHCIVSDSNSCCLHPFVPLHNSKRRTIMQSISRQSLCYCIVIFIIYYCFTHHHVSPSPSPSHLYHTEQQTITSTTSISDSIKLLTTDSCPLGFKQVNITQYWTNSTGPCLICGQRFQCSERWNHSFDNPFDHELLEEEEEEEEEAIRVWSVKGTLFYQFSSCEDAESFKTSRNVSFALNEVNMGNSLLTTGCNCGQCQMSEYMFQTGLMKWSETTHLQLLYSDSTIQLCISRAIIQLCYVDTDVKVTDLRIRNVNNHEQNGTSVILMSSLNGELSYYLEHTIENNGPDVSTGIIQFQQRLQLIQRLEVDDLFPFTFNHLTLLDANGNSVSKAEQLLFQSSCSLSTVIKDSEINLSCGVNLDLFPRFKTSTGPMFAIAMNITLQDTSFSGSVHIASSVSILNSDAIDHISSNNEHTHQISAFSKSQQYITIGETEKRIGYFYKGWSDEIIINSTSVPSGNIIIANIYMSSPISLTTEITSPVRNYSVTVSEKSFHFDNNETLYFFTLTLLQEDDNNNFTITLYPVQDSLGITQFHVQCLSTTVSKLTIDDLHPVERRQSTYDWSFFKISGTSPTTTINALIDSGSIESFNNTLRIYVSNSYVNVWGEDSASEVQASGKPHQWLYKKKGNQDEDYYLAVFGEACPLSCVFNTRMFLTDDNVIKLDLNNPVATLEFEDQSPLVIHYLYKIDLSAWGDQSRALKQDNDSSKQYILRIHTSVSSNSEDLSYLTTFIRKNEYPTENVYDQSRSSDCEQIEDTLVLSVDDMTENQWYFGYIFCCGAYRNTTITVSLETPLEYANEIAPVTLPEVPLYRNIEFLSFNVSNYDEDMDTSTQFLANVTLFHLDDRMDNLTIYSKMDSIPTTDNYDSMLFIEGAGRSSFTLLTDIIFFASGRTIMNQFYDTGNGIITTNPRKGSKLYFRVNVERKVSWCSQNQKAIGVRLSSTTTSKKRLVLGSTERGILGGSPISTDWEQETVSPSVLTAPSQFLTLDLTSLYYQYDKTNRASRSTSMVQIECVIWDVPAVNSSLVDSLWNNTSIIADFDEYPIPGSSKFVFTRSRERYLMKSQVYYSMKFTLKVPLTDLLGTSLQMPGAIGGTNHTDVIIGIYSTDPFAVHSSNNPLSYEIASHFVQSVLIPLESTKLPTTTWSVISVGILYVVVTVIIMFAFSLKFYEKLVKQELTTFDSLSKRGRYLQFVWGDVITRKFPYIPTLGHI